MTLSQLQEFQDCLGQLNDGVSDDKLVWLSRGENEGNTPVYLAENGHFI